MKRIDFNETQRQERKPDDALDALLTFFKYLLILIAIIGAGVFVFAGLVVATCFLNL